MKRLKYIYITCLLICFSCTEEKTVNPINLYIDFTNSSIIDNRFNIDSISFHYKEDSIILYMNNFKIPFFQYHGDIYELRDKYKDFEEYIKTDSILTFSITQDTSFVYKSTIDTDFIPNVFDYSIADSKYEIKKLSEDSYRTVKQSLVDTTYKEVHYYDKKYRISKFINSYKGNICIYIIDR